jgi:hypothetical protein
MQNTWTWDGFNWTERTPAHQPPVLYFTTGAFDPVFKAVVVFGGGSLGVDQKTTWTWNGTDWNQVLPVASPPARELFGTVWDPAKREMLIFGGDNFSTGQFYGDTWKLMAH